MIFTKFACGGLDPVQLSTSEVAKKLSLHVRRLQHWVLVGLLHPRQERRPGLPYVWSANDVGEALSVKQWRAAGMSIDMIRRLLETMRANGWAPAQVQVQLGMTDGTKLELADSWDLSQLQALGVSEQLVIPGWERADDDTEHGDKAMARSPD